MTSRATDADQVTSTRKPDGHWTVVMIPHSSPTVPPAAVAVEESCSASCTQLAVSPVCLEMLLTVGVDVPVLSQAVATTIRFPAGTFAARSPSTLVDEAAVVPPLWARTYEIGTGHHPPSSN